MKKIRKISTIVMSLIAFMLFPIESMTASEKENIVVTVYPEESFLPRNGKETFEVTVQEESKARNIPIALYEYTYLLP